MNADQLSDVGVILAQIHVTLNKNSVPGDKSAMVPGGVRIGSPAMTTRGMVEDDFVKVADLIDRCATAQRAHGRHRSHEFCETSMLATLSPMLSTWVTSRS